MIMITMNTNNSRRRCRGRRATTSCAPSQLASANGCETPTVFRRVTSHCATASPWYVLCYINPYVLVLSLNIKHGEAKGIREVGDRARARSQGAREGWGKECFPFITDTGMTMIAPHRDHVQGGREGTAVHVCTSEPGRFHDASRNS